MKIDEAGLDKINEIIYSFKKMKEEWKGRNMIKNYLRIDNGNLGDDVNLNHILSNFISIRKKGIKKRRIKVFFYIEICLDF